MHKMWPWIWDQLWILPTWDLGTILQVCSSFFPQNFFKSCLTRFIGSYFFSILNLFTADHVWIYLMRSSRLHFTFVSNRGVEISLNGKGIVLYSSLTYLASFGPYLPRIFHLHPVLHWFCQFRSQFCACHKTILLLVHFSCLPSWLPCKTSQSQTSESLRPL